VGPLVTVPPGVGEKVLIFFFFPPFLLLIIFLFFIFLAPTFPLPLPLPFPLAMAMPMPFPLPIPFPLKKMDPVLDRLAIYSLGPPEGRDTGFLFLLVFDMKLITGGVFFCRMI
jgi:hypothetical protein